MLQYQAIDLELEKLQKQKNNFEEVKVLDKMKNIVKEAQGKSIQIESEAGSLLQEYNTLKAQYDKQIKEIQKLTNVELSTLNRSDIGERLTKVNSISSELFMIERNLNIIITKISKALKDFETSKKQAMVARNKHKEVKDEYTKKISEIEPKIAKLEKDLKAMESTLDNALFSKYKAIKNDGIFPVYTRLKDDACGYCRMEIPKNKLDSLKNADSTICEHCRRVIIK